MQEPLPLVIQGLPARTRRDKTPRPPGTGPADWRIDARTRRAGLRGLAQARAALAACAQRSEGHSDAA
ncbi:MAG TPA: hypothetical protein VK428_10680 [Acidimicrobiales bacterium]|nr:hypothetical protein [Acidimicrobiales bacterium]